MNEVILYKLTCPVCSDQDSKETKDYKSKMFCSYCFRKPTFKKKKKKAVRTYKHNAGIRVGRLSL